MKAIAFEVASPYYPYRIYPETFAQVASKSLLLFRPSMMRELENAGCLNDACVVSSVWNGYIDAPRNQWFVNGMNDRGIPLYRCHTTGHASVPDLQRMRGAFPDAIAAPVHLTDRKQFSAIFSNVALHEDGEWWSIAKTHSF